MRKVVLSLALAATSLGFAPAPFPRPDKPDLRTDLQKLQGKWMTAGDLQAVVAGNRLTYSRSGRMVTEYVLTVNPATKPRSYDLKGIGGGAADGRVYRGVYQLQGDKLTLCSRGWGEPRPANFDASQRGIQLMVFTRGKH